MKRTQASLTDAFPDEAVLTGVNPQGATMAKVNLSKMNASRAQLTAASSAGQGPTDLTRANLSRTNLSMAQLTGAVLFGIQTTAGTRLTGARMTGVSREGADFARAHLQRAALAGTKLSSAVLGQVENDSTTAMRRTKLEGTAIRSYLWASLSNLSQQSTSPIQAGFSAPNGTTDCNCRMKSEGALLKNIQGEDLSVYPGLSSPSVDRRETNLKAAKFNWTNVSGVNFTGASAESVNFSHAYVSGANFLSANLVSSNFSGATPSARTPITAVRTS